MLFMPGPVVVAFPVALAVGAVNVLLGTRGQLADATREVTKKMVCRTIQSNPSGEGSTARPDSSAGWQWERSAIDSLPRGKSVAGAGPVR